MQTTRSWEVKKGAKECVQASSRVLSCVSSIFWCLLLNRSSPCSSSHGVGFFACTEDFFLFESYVTITRLEIVTGLQA